MQQYGPELILKGPLMSMVYDEAALNLVLDNLLSANFRVTLASQAKLESALVQRERWYGTEYTVKPLSAELLAFVADPPLHHDLYLPTPNTFIASRLQSKQPISPHPVMHPELIFDKPFARLWHKQDDLFGTPRGCFQALFRTPIPMTSARDSARVHLLNTLLADSLAEVAYDAKLANLHLDTGFDCNGMALEFCGYDEKLPLLLETVLKKILVFQADPLRFLVHKDKYDRRLRNSIHDRPYELGSYYFTGLISGHRWWYWQLLAALPEISAEDITSIIPLIFQNTALEALCHGNFRRDEALAMFKTVQDMLAEQYSASGGSPLRQEPLLGAVRLMPGQHLIFIPKEPVPNANSNIDIYLQIGSLGDLRLRVLTQLFAQIFHESYFDTLRTKEQLGYSVYLLTRDVGVATGLRFIVQSERDPVYLDERIEAFLRDFVPSHLDDMSAEDYSAHQKALISDLLARKQEMTEETSVYWKEIVSRQYEFELAQLDAATVSKITLEEVKEFVRKHVSLGAPQRRKLAVHIWGTASQGIDRAYVSLLASGAVLFRDPSHLATVTERFPSTYFLDQLRRDEKQGV